MSQRLPQEVPLNPQMIHWSENAFDRPGIENPYKSTKLDTANILAIRQLSQEFQEKAEEKEEVKIDKTEPEDHTSV